MTEQDGSPPPLPSAPPLGEGVGRQHGLERQCSVNSSCSWELDPFESPSSTVELTISAKNLINLDPLTKSDPVCILSIKDKTTDSTWVEVDRTECIKNDLNPSWTKKFVVEYRFEERQMLKLSVYDYDGSRKGLDKHDFLGKVELTLGEAVSASNGKLTRRMRIPSVLSDSQTNKDSPSTLTVIAEECDSRKFLSIKLRYNNAQGQKSFKLLPKNVPCLAISKQLDDKTWVLVHRMDRFDQPFHLRLSSITCGGNLERPMKWQVFHKGQNSKWGKAKVNGELRTNYLHLVEHYQGRKGPLQFTKPEKKTRRGSLGAEKPVDFEVEIQTLAVEEHSTFLDLIRNGLQLSLAFGIDFTASNGDPARHSSLHYRYGHVDNPYVFAIKTVGGIISDYSIDKKVTAFGFGGKGFPAGNRVSHAFPLTCKRNDPYCQGIEGVLMAYHRVFKRIKLFGPTCFAPIIQEQIQIAKQNVNGNMYFVLLLITDGGFSDPIATKDAIVKASDLPISIIILGVGEDNDFKEMEMLDCDQGFLKDSKGKLASRDIVQFVELRKFVNFRSIKPIDEARKCALVRAVLAELPVQVCQWMTLFAK